MPFFQIDKQYGSTVVLDDIGADHLIDGVVSAFRQDIEDSAGRIMAAVVTEELSTSEAQTLLLYIQVIRG